MKNILILLLINCFMQAQTFRTVGSGIVIIDSNHCYPFMSERVKIDLKGKITVKGDSLSAIKFLFEWMNDYVYRIKKRDSMLVERDKLIDAAVDFTNNIPDAWKSETPLIIGKDTILNKKWPRYKKLLAKNGYVTCKPSKKK